MKVSRSIWCSLALILAFGATSPAQVVIVGPGATAEGDISRGFGVAAYGMGVYNLYTAQAISINVDTTIRWHQYWADVAFYENQRNAEHRAKMLEKRGMLYKEIQNRIDQNPDERDVMMGNALNNLMGKLRSPQVESSSLRSNNVTISADAIRRIPFAIERQNVRFSMFRLSPNGPDKWPIALRRPELNAERLAYQKAFDAAVDEQIERKTSTTAIRKVESALVDLEDRFEKLGPHANDQLYKEAKRRLREMKASFELLKSLKAEQVIADIETYSGTTIAELRDFMQKHKLRFSPADDDTPEERKLYVELYESMKKQTELLKDDGGLPIR